MGDVADAEADSGDREAEPVTPSRSPAAKRPDKRAEELDVGWGDRPRDPDRLGEDDERLLRERPPHWE